MEIGFSFLNLAPGGAQQLLVQLALELSDRGHRIQYFVHTRLDDPHHVDQHLLGSLKKIGYPVNTPWALQACQVIQLDGYHSLRHKIPFLLTLKNVLRPTTHDIVLEDLDLFYTSSCCCI